LAADLIFTNFIVAYTILVLLQCPIIPVKAIFFLVSQSRNSIDKTLHGYIFLFIPPHWEGRLAIVTVCGAGCGGRRGVRCAQAWAGEPKGWPERAGEADDHAGADGPSRVILAHRLAPWGSAGLSPRTRRGRCVSPLQWRFTQGSAARGLAKQAVKTTACGTPDVSGAFVVTNSCAFYHCAWGCGRIARPAFRAPSQAEGGTFTHSSDVETRREIAKVCLATASRGRRRKYRRTVPCTKVALRRCRSSHLRFATFYCSRGAGKFARRIV